MPNLILAHTESPETFNRTAVYYQDQIALLEDEITRLKEIIGQAPGDTFIYKRTFGINPLDGLLFGLLITSPNTVTRNQIYTLFEDRNWADPLHSIRVMIWEIRRRVKIPPFNLTVETISPGIGWIMDKENQQRAKGFCEATAKKYNLKCSWEESSP